MRVGKRRIGSMAAAVAVGFAAFTGVALAAAGSLTFVEQDKDGVAGVIGLNGAIDVAVSPDGANIVRGGPGWSAVATFTRTRPPAGSPLSSRTPTTRAGSTDRRGARDRGLPNGNHVYVTGNATRRWRPSRATRAPARSPSSSRTGRRGGWTGSPLPGVDVSPDGTHVYTPAMATTPWPRSRATRPPARSPSSSRTKTAWAGSTGSASATGVAVSSGG